MHQQYRNFVTNLATAAEANKCPSDFTNTLKGYSLSAPDDVVVQDAAKFYADTSKHFERISLENLNIAVLRSASRNVTDITLNGMAFKITQLKNVEKGNAILSSVLTFLAPFGEHFARLNVFVTTLFQSNAASNSVGNTIVDTLLSFDMFKSNPTFATLLTGIKDRLGSGADTSDIFHDIIGGNMGGHIVSIAMNYIMDRCAPALRILKIFASCADYIGYVVMLFCNRMRKSTYYADITKTIKQICVDISSAHLDSTNPAQDDSRLAAIQQGVMLRCYLDAMRAGIDSGANIGPVMALLRHIPGYSPQLLVSSPLWQQTLQCAVQIPAEEAEFAKTAKDLVAKVIEELAVVATEFGTTLDSGFSETVTRYLMTELSSGKVQFRPTGMHSLVHLDPYCNHPAELNPYLLDINRSISSMMTKSGMSEFPSSTFSLNLNKYHIENMRSILKFPELEHDAAFKEAITLAYEKRIREDSQQRSMIAMAN